jgi:hypothetical protein
MQGNYPAQIYSAQGVISVNAPTTVVYFWQTSVAPSSVTGNVALTNTPPISHKFASAGSLDVTSPNLGVPVGSTAGARLSVSGYVSNYDSRKNECASIKSVKLLGDDAKARCTTGIVILKGFVESAGATYFTYVPVVNNVQGVPQKLYYNSGGGHTFDIPVQTKLRSVVLGFALTDPVSMASPTMSYKSCTPLGAPTVGGKD